MSGGRVEISLLKNDLEQLASAVLPLRPPLPTSSNNRSSCNRCSWDQEVASTKSLPRREGLSRKRGAFSRFGRIPVWISGGVHQSNGFGLARRRGGSDAAQVGLKTGDKAGSCFNNSHKSGRHQEGIRYRASHLSRVSLPLTRDNLRDRFRIGLRLSVVRFKPRRAAAPSARRAGHCTPEDPHNRSRSLSRSVSPLLLAGVVFNSLNGTCKTKPGVRITERSMSLPVRGYFPATPLQRRLMVLAGML